MKAKSQARHSLKLEQTYEEVKKLIFQQAWRMAKRHEMPFDDALSECNDAFMRAFHNRYDEKRGMKFSTFLQFLIQCRFRTIQYRGNKRRIDMIPLDDSLVAYAPPVHTRCTDVVHTLSSDAQTIVKLLLDTPKELVETAVPESLLTRAMRFAHFHGIPKENLNEACEEIRSAFSQVWATA